MRKRAAALILSVVPAVEAEGPRQTAAVKGVSVPRVRRMAVAAEKKWLACA